MEEVITPEGDRLVVRQNDALDFAGAITALINNPENRADLRRVARKTTEDHFDVDVCEGPFHDHRATLVAGRGKKG